MTDEQISEIASPFLEWTEQGYAVIDKIGFARALLSASSADTAVTTTKVAALSDEQIVRAIRKANIALVNGLGEKAAANAFRSALPDGENIASVKDDPIAWAVPVEIEHLQKGYRNSAVICNRNEGAYTLPVYIAMNSTECKASPSGHPCNRGKGHEGPCGVSECNRPPNGWRCTRQAGHEGPCAAIKIEG